MVKNRIKRVFFAAFFLLAITAAFSIAYAGIKDSKHDFSADSTGTPFAGDYWVGGVEINEICVFCHTPHGASTANDYKAGGAGGANAPLWNRAVNHNPDGYVLYSGASVTVENPTGVSLMCLSCHDGISSIAVGTMLVNTPGSGSGTVTRPSNFDKIESIYYDPDYNVFGYWGPNIGDTDLAWPVGYNNPPATYLANDHPISFDFPPGGSEAAYGLKPNVRNGFSDTTVKLFSDRMECSTCHNVHSNDKPPFLRMLNTNSDMCLTCHDK